jgi:hypothetical protein
MKLSEEGWIKCSFYGYKEELKTYQRALRGEVQVVAGRKGSGMF